MGVINLKIAEGLLRYDLAYCQQITDFYNQLIVCLKSIYLHDGV